MKLFASGGVALLLLLLAISHPVVESWAPLAFVSRHHHHAMPTVHSSTSSSFVRTTPLLRATLSTLLDSTDTSSSPSVSTSSSSSSSSSSLMTMLVESSGGMEQLVELTEQADQQNVLAKQVRKSPSFFKFAGLASIPLSAMLGFGLVPSRRIAAHAVGGLVTGLAGAVGKSKMDALTAQSAKPALAQALIDAGLQDPLDAQQAIRSVQDTYGLVEEDFAILCTEIYTSYLLGMVKYTSVAKTSELKELESLKTALALDNLQVGEAHVTAAREWYRTTCLFTPPEDLDDPDHSDRQAMDKLLFLTERALRQGDETPEAFVFEMTRCAKALHLTDLTTALERVADVVEPFYQRALQSTRTKLASKAVSPGMLERARQTLGVSDAVALDLHVACYNEQVRELLGKPSALSGGENATTDLSSIKFKEGSLEVLDQLRDILGLSETDADYEIGLEARPIYQETALAAMQDVLAKTKSADDAWAIMERRREDLLLKESASKDLVSSMVMQALGGPLEECNKFAKVNNEAATYENLLEALEAKEALIAILAKSGWEEYDRFDEIFCNPWDKQSANGFLMSEDRIKLYRIFLNRSARKAPDGKLSDEIYEKISEVKGLLGISDPQAEIEARGAFGPKLQHALQRATMEIVGDYTPELVDNMQKEVDQVLENYRLSQDYLRESGATYYNKAVALVSEKAPAGVPTKDLSAALQALRTMFHLSEADAHPAHMEYFGSVYKKSVREAMGSTGVIREEYREPLDDLRVRLGLAKDDARKLFLEAVEDKMVPMVEWIGSEMERTMLNQQQLSQRRKKDMGEDMFQSGRTADGVLGLGAEVNIMSDIMELVDFYKENNIADTQKVQKTVEVDGEQKLVEEEVPHYPVTALAAGAIDQELAELLYRQFVVGGFTSQGEKAARYEANRPIFAGILGLDQASIETINSNIGETVYDNLVSNAMKTKGTMDQQDMMFLANIQGKLDLTPQQGEKMLLQAQKKILSEEIEVIMDDPTPSTIKGFREKCNSLGVDLAQDIGMSKARLARMFESEVVPGLKKGEITTDNANVLGEILESLGIDADDGETMFENTLVRLSKNAMDVINGELMRGRDDNVVDLIKEIIRYAAFTDGDLGLQVDEATANKLFNIYDSMDFSDLSREEVEANKELLRSAMGIAA